MFKPDAHDMLQIKENSFIFLILVIILVNHHANLHVSAVAPNVSSPSTFVSIVVSRKRSIKMRRR